MTRYDILLNKKSPEPVEKLKENQPRSPYPGYIDIPRLPRQELFPDDEYKGYLPNLDLPLDPPTWRRWDIIGKYTTDYSSFIYRRPVK